MARNAGSLTTAGDEESVRRRRRRPAGASRARAHGHRRDRSADTVRPDPSADRAAGRVGGSLGGSLWRIRSADSACPAESDRPAAPSVGGSGSVRRRRAQSGSVTGGSGSGGGLSGGSLGRVQGTGDGIPFERRPPQIGDACRRPNEPRGYSRSFVTASRRVHARSGLRERAFRQGRGAAWAARAPRCSSGSGVIQDLEGWRSSSDTTGGADAELVAAARARVVPAIGQDGFAGMQHQRTAKSSRHRCPRDKRHTPGVAARQPDDAGLIATSGSSA